MDSKDTKSSHLKATHHELGEPEHARRGEAIMKSDDPSTAALRYVLLTILPPSML